MGVGRKKLTFYGVTLDTGIDSADEIIGSSTSRTDGIVRSSTGSTDETVYSITCRTHSTRKAWHESVLGDHVYVDKQQFTYSRGLQMPSKRAELQGEIEFSWLRAGCQRPR
jgi:hypothetical protein